MSNVDALARGRDALNAQRWGEGFELLRAAGADAPLAPADLDGLAIAAYLTGHDDESIDTRERAHQAFLADGEIARAARAAFWLAFQLVNRGEPARGGGWVARAQRLLDDSGLDCVERGYLLLPAGLQQLAVGDPAAARSAFSAAAEIAGRFDDADLMTLARLGNGQSLVHLGEITAGTALLDEAMVAVIAGAVSPIITGVVYCGVIETCQAIFDLRRAQEWTAAFTHWCESRPDLVPYRGQCLAFRSEIMRLRGAWPDALDEARRAQAALARPPVHPAVGTTLYQQAEVHRLRGDYPQAEDAYREASRWGHPPEPGLPLLRLYQGRTDAAAGAMRRVLDEAQDRRTRFRLLPAYIEIMLALGSVDAARAAADELIAGIDGAAAPFLRAAADRADGEVLLAQGEPRTALGPLRRAWSGWQALEMPYEAARVRVLIARACRELGDDDSSDLEIDAARWAFELLGAAADLARLDAAQLPAASLATPLTPRELEVLRLVAAGSTNRDIAAQLVISDKTVARHVSNILAKLSLPSRAGATAYAYEHGLV